MLLSASHPSAVGNWSNILAPAADVSEQSIEDLCTQIMGAEDHNGLKIGLQPQGINIPRQIWFGIKI